MLLTIFLFVIFFNFKIQAINHWILKDDGRIMQKIDSPFYMRNPDNLPAFLNQIRYNDYVEKSYLQLLHQREEIVEHLRFSVQFGEELVEQAKCAMDYYLMEKRMSYLKVTPSYLKRLNIPEHNVNANDDNDDVDANVGNDIEINVSGSSAEPFCDKVIKLAAGPCGYDHLESFRPDIIELAYMDREDDMNINEPGSATDILRKISVKGLKNAAKSWKFHTLSSYYWRMRGHAQNALACSRIGVMLAPREYKDIPLLSLGTILFRIGRLADADVILTAAVEHAPNVSENHIALASALALKHDFYRSLRHFDEAERLDASHLPRTLPVRNFITCLENLTKKTAKMYSYVEYMKNEVKEFKKLKQKISKNHEKLIRQQVPLGARALDLKSSDSDLHKRGQYCSTRTFSNSDEPVLFCDFYSDLQMRLESKDVDIESLERDLKLTSEAVVRQVSTEFRKQLNFEQIKATKAQKPASPKNAAAADNSRNSKETKGRDT